MKLAHIYHNMGVLFQAGKDYAKAVDAYKMSLRNNPADHETRYNLALAQKMLKDQQNQQDQDQIRIRIKISSRNKTRNRTKTKINRTIRRKTIKRISNNRRSLKNKIIRCQRKMLSSYLILYAR